MNQDPVLARAGEMLQNLLRGALVPGVLFREEDIRLTWPQAQEDYRLGISLYDIEAVRPYGTPLPVRVGETERRGPAGSFALRFLVYVNRKVPFDSMSAEDELVLLEAVLRAVYNAEPRPLAGEEVSIRLDPVTRQEKAALWQSFSTPMQPAVYLIMEPLKVPSDKLEHFVPVRSIQVKSSKKEGGSSP